MFQGITGTIGNEFITMPSRVIDWPTGLLVAAGILGVWLIIAAFMRGAGR